MTDPVVKQNPMRHWDALKTTDPRHTKKVEFGRKFTSIDAQWQIMRMTEQFGPVGQGWGYEVHHAVQPLDDKHVLSIADVVVWWKEEAGNGARYRYGPVRGMSFLMDINRSGQVVYDDDAGKKATTDALTKGLSHLGVSADVFLGLFDDNKYVESIKRKFAAEDTARTNLPSAVQDVLERIAVAVTSGVVQQLEATWNQQKAVIDQMNEAHRNLVMLRFSEAKATITRAAAGRATASQAATVKPVPPS
jgi:hypothetical protein